MAGYTDAERERLRSWNDAFRHDPLFEITSDPVPFYNCIGFAMGMTDVCVALGNSARINWQWWPPTAHRDMNPNSLVEAFTYFGFEDCGMDDTIDPDYDKVALYSKAGEWTHAAWIDEENVYHSKLGAQYDITHGPGAIFHETCYGDIYKYMKRLKTDAHITADRKPKTGFMRYEGKIYAVMEDHGKNCGYVRIA